MSSLKLKEEEEEEEELLLLRLMPGSVVLGEEGGEGGGGVVDHDVVGRSNAVPSMRPTTPGDAIIIVPGGLSELDILSADAMASFFDSFYSGRSLVL